MMRPLSKFGFVAIQPPLKHRTLYAKRWHSVKVSNPLRVLFCGSDEFSCSSLEAIHAEQQRNPELIASIDVLCRPGKRSGRSMKHIRELPIKWTAQSLGLPVHEVDSFRGWNLPRPQNEAINLIVAVSFGLFVPPRILQAAEYGGVNVHPSLLPNFRGPAPLQHTIISGEETTGFTVQTLDHNSFDHGVILAQTPPPGLPIPLADKCTYDDLLQFAKPRAAEMLVQTLRDRAFVPPLVEPSYKYENLKHAPKITPADRHVRWYEWDTATIYRRHRALHRLWSQVWVDGKKEKRMIFEDLEPVPIPGNYFPLSITGIPDELKLPHRNRETDEQPPLGYAVFTAANGEKRPLFYAPDGDAIIVFSDSRQALRIKYITIEGQKPKPARRVMQNISRGASWRLVLDENDGNQVPSVELVE